MKIGTESDGLRVKGSIRSVRGLHCPSVRIFFIGTFCEKSKVFAPALVNIQTHGRFS